MNKDFYYPWVCSCSQPDHFSWQKEVEGHQAYLVLLLTVVFTNNLPKSALMPFQILLPQEDS
jgi:hypothetical protein